MDENNLVLEGLGPRFILVPMSGNDYFIEESFSTGEFQVDGQGRTTSLTLNMGQRLVTGERVEMEDKQ